MFSDKCPLSPGFMPTYEGEIQGYVAGQFEPSGSILSMKQKFTIKEEATYKFVAFELVAKFAKNSNSRVHVYLDDVKRTDLTEEGSKRFDYEVLEAGEHEILFAFVKDGP
jgi:hypothetical protein